MVEKQTHGIIAVGFPLLQLVPIDIHFDLTDALGSVCKYSFERFPL